MGISRWRRGAVWLVVFSLAAIAVRVRHGLPAPPPAPPAPKTAEEAIRLAAEIREFARDERLRAWAEPGLASSQAASLAAKAEYFLHTRGGSYRPGSTPNAGDIEEVYALWVRLRRAGELSRRGARELPEEPGARMRGYMSEVDCSLQTYSLTIPGEYDPLVTWPLIVSMHGHGWYSPYQGHPAPGFGGAFCLSPHGRGATDYKELGELDVLRCIDEVMAEFRIDPNRVYLTGSSMGGTGAWHLGVHHADRFAGILPIAGNADHRAWVSRWGWNAPFPGRMDDIRKLIQDAQSAEPFAGNLLNLPSIILHGGADTIVPPEHARNMVAALRRSGASADYYEFPEVGHGGFPGWAVQWTRAEMLGFVREESPKRIRWRADRLRCGKAYWLRLEEKLRPLGPAEIDAEVGPDGSVSVRTENLAAFSIDRSNGLFAANRPLFLRVDGNRVILPPLTAGDTGGKQGLRLYPGRGWDSASFRPPIPPGPRKQAWLEGPVSEVMLRPFAAVVGTTSADATVRSLWINEGLSFAREWKRRNLVPCPIVRDIDVDDTLESSRNLILFGGADANAVSARLAPLMPLNDILSATEREQPGIGAIVLYPNPEFPDKLVVLVDARGPEAIYQGWQRFGNWFNWGVYDSSKYFDYAVYDAKSVTPESMRVFGYYDTSWRVDPAYRFTGVESVRETLADQLFPTLEKPPEGVRYVDLADLRPKAIDHMRGAVGIGRTFQGTPLTKGLGMRAPCTLDYELDGTFSRLTAAGLLLNGPETTLGAIRTNGEKVRFSIRGDGRLLAEAVASWQTPRVFLDADLTGVRQLRLETAPAGGPAWLHAGAGWGYPRIHRK